MKLQRQKCSNCGKWLNLKGKNKGMAFCPYCGEKHSSSADYSGYLYSENVSMNIGMSQESYRGDIVPTKKIYKHESENFNKKLIFIGVFVAVFAILVGVIWGGISKNIKQREIEKKGLISAGSYHDFVGENYQDVEVRLKAMGFTNIELVEVTEGYREEQRGKVKSISIGGKTDFKKREYFSSDVKVIISFYRKDGGLINAGNSEDYIGQDYEAVRAHLIAAGFENIELVGISAGLAMWNKGEVVSVSIAGKTTFSSYDYFNSDAPVVISYYRK